MPENPDARAGTTAGPPTPLGEPLVMARGVPAALSGRLRVALERVLEAGPDLVLVAGVAAIAVRAAEPSTVTGARLELPDAVPDLLGGEIETQVLADGKRLRVWLAGAARIEPGTTVSLIAITAGGKIAEVTIVAGTSQATLELSLPWDNARMPEAVALVFKQLRS